MKFSKISLLQFILFIAILLVPAEDRTMFAWWLGGALAFELLGFYLLELFKHRPIKPGDVVQLRSGGPKMVADELHAGSGWWCFWFDEAGNRQDVRFRAHLLNRA
ncbi:MAG: putative small protein [Hymenobacter sp.]|nr:putative small protein [Hymenobacter sp.]